MKMRTRFTPSRSRTPTTPAQGTPPLEPGVDGVLQLGGQHGPWRLGGPALGAHHHVGARRSQVRAQLAAESLAQPPPHAVAIHGAAYLPGQRDAETGVGKILHEEMHDEMWSPLTMAFGENP